jgi:XTP/dITP diphosphohydrolase
VDSLIVATRNEHKLRELREIITGIELLPLPEEIELPPEWGDTFRINAAVKATAAATECGHPAIGDDSGIEAAALGGRPGVYSARYAGENATDEENLAKLLEEVAAAGEDRRVAYVCVIALAQPDGSASLFEGRCEGTLTTAPRGSGGFGYDPAFVPDETGPGDNRTMAELSPEEKHAISHRGRAAEALAEAIGAGG